MRTKYVNYMSLFIYYVFIDFFSVNCDCPFPISLQVGARCRTATSAKTRAWPTSCASRWGPGTIPTSRPRSWRMARWILASADPRSSSPGVCGWDRKRGGPMGPMGPQWGMGLRSVAKVMVGKNRCLNLMNWIMGGGVWKKGVKQIRWIRLNMVFSVFFGGDLDRNGFSWNPGPKLEALGSGWISPIRTGGFWWGVYLEDHSDFSPPALG